MMSRYEEANNYLCTSGIKKEISSIFPDDQRLTNTIFRATINRHLIENGELENMGESAYDVLLKMNISDRNVGEKSLAQIQKAIDLMGKKNRSCGTRYLSLAGLAIKKNNRYKTTWAFARIDVSK